MKKEVLQEHVNSFVERLKKEPEIKKEYQKLKGKADLYQRQTRQSINSMEKEEFTDLIGSLLGAKKWGNKNELIDKLIEENGFSYLKKRLAEFIWSEKLLENRWDEFRREVKSFGPAMMSEMLCLVYPKEFMIWNRKAFVALKYLGIDDLPRYNYQCTGKKYLDLCNIAQNIAKEIKKAGVENVDLLLVDIFIRKELQVGKQINKIHIDKIVQSARGELENEKDHKLVNEEIIEKISQIGKWLGFTTSKDTKVAGGSVVDVVWEAKIGNMGRIIYVFEVLHNNIDGLILNLLKSLNNPAVQGVVAVSDEERLEKIKNEAKEVGNLRDKLKYWDFNEVLDNYEALSFVNESISRLDLVPDGKH